MKRFSTLTTVLVFGSLVLGACGCNGKTKSENEALWKENKELHDELSTTRAALEAANAERARAQQEAADRAATGAPASGGSLSDLQGGGVTVTQEGNQTTVSIAGDVLFDSGKATLKSTMQSKLKEMASILNQNPSQRISVEGHSDSDPIKKSGWRDNYHLSEARASAVRDFLANQGVSRARMSILGHGPDKPVAPNTTAGKAKNRRVEVIVTQ